MKLDDSGVEAFVVIDSRLGGGGTGGIRMSEAVTLEEVADLAHEMTLKFAWLNIPRGGAKSGIACKGNMPEVYKRRLLKEFGRSVSDLLQSREYVAGMDLGIGPADLTVILSSAGLQSGMPIVKNDIDPNYFTALTVFVSLKVLLHQKETDLSDVGVLIEGVGKVSTHLMRMIVATGARITGVSTIAGAIVDVNGIDIEKFLSLRRTHGDDCVKYCSSSPLLAPENLYLQPADVLIPGARPYSINENNIDEVRAKFVVPIANIPASRHVETMLHERGTSYMPGFVTNSGGVFCWYLARLSRPTRKNIIRKGFADKIRRLIDEATRKNMSIAMLARSQAEKNAKRMMLEERGPFLDRMTGTARKLDPRRLAYATLHRVSGNRWGREDSLLCRSYFDAKYFR